MGSPLRPGLLLHGFPEETAVAYARADGSTPLY